MKLPLELNRVPIVTKSTVIASAFLSLSFWLLDYRTSFSSNPKADHGSNAGSAGVSSGILTLIPQSSYYLPWTFVSSSLVNPNVFSLGIALATLLLGGRYLERAYSSRELAKFYAVLILVPNVTLFLSLFLLALCTQDRAWLSTSIYGSVALQAGILVAFKQLVPEHTVTMYRQLVKIRVKHFPALFLLSTIVSAPILGNYAAIATSILGFLSGWVYLRFYKISLPDLGAQMVSIKGDASETFSLSQFFPDIVQAPIDRLSETVFELLVSIGVCLPFGQDVLESTNEFGHRTAGTGVGRAEAERRRTAALRALDQKMTRQTNESTQDVRSGSASLPPQVDH